MTITAEHRDLIDRLIRQALTDDADLKRRWGKAAPDARRRAQEGYLLLTPDWVGDAVLNSEGEVSFINTESKEPQYAFTTRMRRSSLFLGSRRYPELKPLLPERPPNAITCPHCEETGTPKIAATHPIFKSIVCRCGGYGWDIPGEE